jgi:hypothetical protein
MSDTKISALSSAGAPQSADIIPLARAGTGPLGLTIANLFGSPQFTGLLDDRFSTGVTAPMGRFGSTDQNRGVWLGVDASGNSNIRAFRPSDNNAVGFSLVLGDAAAQVTVPGTFGVTGATTFGARANLPSYTVGTLPAAGVAGGMVYCSNAAGNGPCIAMSNGSVWKRCDNVSTTVV